MSAPRRCWRNWPQSSWSDPAKRAASTMAALPSARGRLFSGIGLLVPKAAPAEGESHLMLASWMRTEHDAYEQRNYPVWTHDISAMQHRHHASVIEVHPAIVPLTASLRPDPGMPRAGRLTSLAHSLLCLRANWPHMAPLMLSRRNARRKKTARLTGRLTIVHLHDAITWRCGADADRPDQPGRGPSVPAMQAQVLLLRAWWSGSGR